MNETASVPVAVADTERLHRVTDPQNVRDGKPHYMAFYSKTEPARISVDRAEYRSIEETLVGEPPGTRIAALIAGEVRALPIVPPLRVESCPENGNEAHAEIRVGDAPSKSFIKTKVCAMLADISSMV
jgi:hypothetical protein